MELAASARQTTGVEVVGAGVDGGARSTKRADPATRVPGRLACAGPWWDAVPSADSPADDAELAALEALLLEADGRRVSAQREARQELAALGEPVTRLSVARLAVGLLRHDEEVVA